ncbi:hypothetical protein PT2222_10465 [Paraburkholderia tropica]
MNLRRHNQKMTRGQLYTFQRLANTLRKCIFPEHEEGHIGAQFQCQFLQFETRQIELPEAVQREQRGGRVGAAAAETGAHRQTLFDVDLDAFLRTRVLLEQLGRAHGEIVFGRHAFDFDGARDAAVVAAREMQRIAPVEQLEHGLQIVIAIRAAARDVQEEIEFRGREAVAQRVLSFGHGALRLA